MKEKNIALVIIACIFCFAVIQKANETQISFPILLTFFILAILFVNKEELLNKMKNKNKADVKEALSLINFESFFPEEILKPINRAFSKEKTNLALGVLRIDGEVHEYYVALSNSKADKYADKYTTIGKEEKPIFICKDEHSAINFIIRGPEGELVPLNKEDINTLEKMNTDLWFYGTSFRLLDSQK